MPRCQKNDPRLLEEDKSQLYLHSSPVGHCWPLCRYFSGRQKYCKQVGNSHIFCKQNITWAIITKPRDRMSFGTSFLRSLRFLFWCTEPENNLVGIDQ